MKKVCAWCQKSLEETKEVHNDNGPISHGICPDCFRAVSSRKSRPLNDFLDTFSEPIFVLDREGRIASANTRACRMLNKDLRSLTGQLGGDAFECRYADLPEGCGQTIHCKTCTIRNTVMQTLETGKGVSKARAYPDLHLFRDDKTVRFLISTEKIGDAVILRIDDVETEPE